MNTNFYNYICNFPLYRIFCMDNKERKIASYYNKVKKHIVQDLKEIERNKENDTCPKYEFKYYNIIIKGRNTVTWRVYFLRIERSYVAFPLPNGKVIVQKLYGGDYGHDYNMEPDSHSAFWLPTLPSLNYEYLNNIIEEIDSKKFVYDWIKSNTNYDDVNKNGICTFENNIYVELNK